MVPTASSPGSVPGKTIIDMSTVSPAVSRETGEQVRARGADMLDSPVSGSISTLEQGKLTMMVGGKPETFEKVKPLLLDIGMKATHVGDNGVAVVDEDRPQPRHRVADARVFRRRPARGEGRHRPQDGGRGLHQQRARLADGPVPRARSCSNMPEEAWFDVKMMQKDTTLALEMGRRLGVALPTTAVANEMLTAARGLGLEKKDCAAVFNVLAKLSGVQA